MKIPEYIKQDIIDCMDEAIVVNETGDAHDLLDFTDKAHVCMATALTYIQQLESNYSQVSKALCCKENATLEEILQAVSQVKAELEAVKRERDAAVRDFKSFAQCKNNICHYCVAAEAMCGDCGWRYPDLFIWRGVCPENTEVQDDE